MSVDMTPLHLKIQ